MVLSVSKTFIKLKDLILEKTSLQKETNRLKSLNKHLDGRLRNQENRLGVVTVELTKTWHLVGRMQRQHRQLHTNEQILRYQLQRKRKMLNELKEELEYCRKKWTEAREKNNDSEDQWRSLQKEFASRKLKTDIVTSAESGYSDEQNSDDDDKTAKKVFWAATNDSPKRSNSFSEDVTVDSGTEIENENTHRLRGRSEPNEIYQSETYLTIDETDESTSEPSNQIEPGTSSSSKDISPVDYGEPGPSTSSNSSEKTEEKTYLTEAEEAYTARRAERIRRLEEQCKQLMSKVSNTNNRGDKISSQLNIIHDRYGRLTTSPAVPPIPESTQSTPAEDSTITTEQPTGNETTEVVGNHESDEILGSDEIHWAHEINVADENHGTVENHTADENHGLDENQGVDENHRADENHG